MRRTVKILDHEHGVVESYCPDGTKLQKLAIIGFAASSKDLAPYDDPTWEIVGLNQLYRHISRADRWLEIHSNWNEHVVEGTVDGIELWINRITGIQTGFPTDVLWLSEDPASGILTPGGVQTIQVKVDTTGLVPGIYHANLSFRTKSARQPTLRVPVSVLVPAYQHGVNAGGKAYTDRAGDKWAADKQYAAGSWGYANKSTTSSTKKGVSGTDDDPLYQDLRSGVLEYRFDGWPAGVYQLELRFAELKPTQPGLHMFDVLASAQRCW